jgi:hypothetical protein
MRKSDQNSPLMNEVRLEVKGTKLDLSIFRWPSRQVNEYDFDDGCLRSLCDEVDQDFIYQYCYSEPIAGYLSAFILVTNHGGHLPFSQTATSSKESDCNSSLLPSHRHEG